MAFWTSYRYSADRRLTNNTTEYNAIVDCLLCAKQHGIQHLHIEGDSTLIVEQIKGKYACSIVLRSLRDLVRDVPIVCLLSLNHIGRFCNSQRFGTRFIQKLAFAEEEGEGEEIEPEAENMADDIDDLLIIIDS